MPETTLEKPRTDRRAFEILVRQQHRQLMAYALALAPDPHQAQDLVQEAFLTAHPTTQPLKKPD